MPFPDGFHRQDGVLLADRVPLQSLASQYGTPVYVYSASAIRRNIDVLRTALGPDVLIAYACKANSNGAVLSIMGRAGLGADVVSGGELLRAMAAGIPAEKIVFSGVGKTDEELRLAISRGIAQINIESGEELERLIEIGPRVPVRVGFRLNPGVETDTHAKISTGHVESKFGSAAEEIVRLYAIAAAAPRIVPAGVSVHIGSQLMTAAPFAAAFSRVADLVRTLRSQALTVDTVDIGGGLGIVYNGEAAADIEGYAKAVREIIRPFGVRVIAEPGRFLVGNAGVLLSRVIGIKQTAGQEVVIIDAGMNDLMRPALYDAVHAVEPAISPSGETKRLDVAGPVCESSDVFLQDWPMIPPARGDVVALMNTGAYGMSMAGTYNSRPMPAEILVDGERHGIIRQRQTLDDIIKDERIPDWLTR